jgi:hypothetical protein
LPYAFVNVPWRAFCSPVLPGFSPGDERQPRSLPSPSDNPRTHKRPDILPGRQPLPRRPVSPALCGSRALNSWLTQAFCLLPIPVFVRPILPARCALVKRECALTTEGWREDDRGDAQERARIP